MDESNNEERTDRPNFKHRVTAEWARFRQLAWWKRLVHPLAIVASLSIIALFCLLAAGFIRLILPRSGSIRFWRAQDYVRPESAADRAALLLAEVYATQAFIEIIGSLVLVITVIAALYTARQTQRSLELGREQLRISQDGQITDRFAKAIEMLGATHSNGTPQMEVRLGGIYALERLAQDSCRGDENSSDWCRDHWPIMEVLSAYIRGNSAEARKEMVKRSSVHETRDGEMSTISLVGADGQPLRGSAQDFHKTFEIQLRFDIESLVKVLRQRNESQFAHERRIGRRLVLDGAHLEGASLVDAHLEGASLNRAHLKKARLDGANLKGAELDSANLEGARLDSANLEGARLDSANLEGASLNRAHLKKARLDRANLKGAVPYQANLEGASLFDAHLERALLFEANLEGALLLSAKLQGARLDRANLEGASLNSAHLKKARLDGANLKGAELDSANLEGASLIEANLKGAVLDRSNLEGARLDRANLEGARLEGAYLTAAHLQGARLQGAPLEGADLTAVHLEGAYLQGAHLEKARLQGAHLKGARLQGAHLEGAYLRGVDGLAQWQIDAAFTDDETILPLGLSPDGVQYRHSTRPAGAKSSSVQEHICAFITEGDRILSSSTDEHSPRDFCLVNSLDMFVSASSARALQLASRTTGVSDPEFVRYLGDQWISHSDHYDHRFFFHLSFSSATPDDWKFTSQKMRPLDPDPIERSFRWITLDPNNPPDLPDGLGHRLPDLLKSMEMQKESK